MANTKVRVLWVEMRWKPPLGPSLPGYLYRDAESTALDKRTPAQLRRTLGQPLRAHSGGLADLVLKSGAQTSTAFC